MKTGPLVTINIPTYNQEKYIARAIESCLAQDYPNLEIIVSDDCSTDATYSIAKRFESSRVKVYQTPQNLGRVKNYRYALYQLARGEWVVNLDGDDFYNDATFISEAVKRLIAHPSCVMYVGGASTLYELTGKMEKGPIYFKDNITVMKGTDYVLNFYKQGQIGQHFAALYNRNIALQTDFYILDSLGADTDSICRLALKGDVLVQKKWVGMWTSHGSNVSYTLSITAVDKELKMLEHIGNAAKQHLPAEVVNKWLTESKQLKFKQALYPTLPALPWYKAMLQVCKYWQWQLQDFKELIKIFLRPIYR